MVPSKQSSWQWLWLAQLAERLPPTAEVCSSNPVYDKIYIAYKLGPKSCQIQLGYLSSEKNKVNLKNNIGFISSIRKELEDNQKYKETKIKIMNLY